MREKKKLGDREGSTEACGKVIRVTPVQDVCEVPGDAVYDQMKCVERKKQQF